MGQEGLRNGLVSRLNGVLLRKDAVNDGFTASREDEIYKTIRQGSYKAVENLAADNLSLGMNVFIEGTYTDYVRDPNWVRRFEGIAKETRAAVKLIRCIVPPEIVLERLTKRNFERDASKLMHFDEFLQREPIQVPMPQGSLALDTSVSYDQAIARSEQYLLSEDQSLMF